MFRNRLQINTNFTTNNYGIFKWSVLCRAKNVYASKKNTVSALNFQSSAFHAYRFQSTYTSLASAFKRFALASTAINAFPFLFSLFPLSFFWTSRTNIAATLSEKLSDSRSVSGSMPKAVAKCKKFASNRGC